MFSWPKTADEWEQYKLSDEQLSFHEEQAEALDNPVPVEMKKGYATFQHSLLVHGSFENNSERPRRAFVLNTFAHGTRSDTDEPLLKGVPATSKGNTLGGRFFPLLDHR